MFNIQYLLAADLMDDQVVIINIAQGGRCPVGRIAAAESMETDIADETFAVVAGPAKGFVQQYRSIDRHCCMAVGIAARIAFDVQVHMVPFSFADSARGRIGKTKIIPA